MMSIFNNMEKRLGFVLLYVILHCSLTVCQDAPWFPLTYTIEEEQGSFTYIGNVGRDATPLLRKYGDNLSGLQFSFLPADNPYQELFTINPTSGIFKTAKKIDRDALCPGEPICGLNIDVGVLGPTRDFDIVKITVNIIDLNDNPPRFPAPQQTLTVSESALPGTTLALPPAQDPDSGDFGIKAYSYISNSDTFALKVNNNTEGTQDILLELKGPLDREVQNRYSLQVMAKDGGRPPLEGSLELTIVIGDINDNGPVFTQKIYKITVAEDFPLNRTLMKVQASDRDEGLNGQIMYGFNPQTLTEYGDLFTINAITGDVHLQKRLDYEKQTSYRLTVAAQDRGTNSIPVYAKLIVNLLDVNDFAPKITVNSINPRFADMGEIPENSKVGDFVVSVRVEDSDAGESGQVDCVINDGNFELMNVFGPLYKILAKNIFDREQQAFYDIVMECADHGVPPLHSRKDIRIAVTDVNDNAPVFSRQTYSATLSENNPVDMAVIRVNATDRDDGPNAEITYTLAGDDVHHYLTIDPTSGQISTNGFFDYETMRSFRCTVVARDNAAVPRNNATGAHGPKSTSATVTITILDTNDNPPMFSSPKYDFVTYENQPVGTEIGTVNATDPDTEPYNTVRYLLEPDLSPLDTFAIDEINGKITLKQVLDREYIAVYALVVIATNPPEDSPSSSATVTIHVADVNDNAPLIHFPNHENRTVHLPYLSPKGYAFTRIKATDADFGDKGRLTYTIDKGNDEGLFDIDMLTGTLLTTRELKDVKREQYNLIITVKDQGSPQKTAMADLTVFVNRTLAVPFFNDLLEGADNSQDGGGLNQNQTILIAMSIVTAFLVVVLILAIIYVKRKQSDKGDDLRYKRDLDSGKGRGEGRGRVEARPGVVVYGAMVPGKQPPAPSAADISHHSPRKQTSSENLDTSRETGEGESEEVDFCGTGGREVPNPRPQEGRTMTTFRSPHVPYDSASHDSHSDTSSTATLKPSHIPRHRLLPAEDANYPLAAWSNTERDLEVHRLLNLALQDHQPYALNGGDSDNASGCSAELSNTDSGRGASENGDADNHTSPRNKGDEGSVPNIPAREASNKSSVPNNLNVMTSQERLRKTPNTDKGNKPTNNVFHKQNSGKPSQPLANSNDAMYVQCHPSRGPYFDPRDSRGSLHRYHPHPNPHQQQNSHPPHSTFRQGVPKRQNSEVRDPRGPHIPTDNELSSIKIDMLRTASNERVPHLDSVV